MKNTIAGLSAGTCAAVSSGSVKVTSAAETCVNSVSERAAIGRTILEAGINLGVGSGYGARDATSSRIETVPAVGKSDGRTRPRYYSCGMPSGGPK